MALAIFLLTKDEVIVSTFLVEWLECFVTNFFLFNFKKGAT